MGKRASLIKQAMNRLDSLMAIGASRYEAKAAARDQARSDGQAGPWTVTTHKIHSYQTRKVYQEHVLAWANWARDTHQIRTLDALLEQSEALATEYLSAQVAAKKSAYTIHVQRAALRMFVGDRGLANSVKVPRRARSTITRSRRPAERDKQFQPANHQHLIRFLRATGLRRSEVRDLRTGDILRVSQGLRVIVRNGKGGKLRDVPVLPGHEEHILAALQGRQNGAHIFDRIPSHLDVHSYRREYAQALYCHLSGRELPPSSGRLRRLDYDKDATLQVSHALGHNRIDVILKHYIR